MELAQRKPGNGSIAFRISSRRIHVHSTHLPGDDPERADVASLRAFGANKLGKLRVNQFGSSIEEEPIDVDPRHSEWNRGRSKASDAGMSVSADENVGLGKRECMTKSG